MKRLQININGDNASQRSSPHRKTEKSPSSLSSLSATSTSIPGTSWTRTEEQVRLLAENVP